MNIAFLGGLFPHELQAEITDSSKGCIQNAANALQWGFVDGLNKILHKPITVINLPYIGSFPLTYRHVFIKHGVFGCKYGVKGVSVPFCNLILYKNYSRYTNSKKAIEQWVKDDENNRLIIIYAIHSPFLKAAQTVKQNFPDLTIVLIVPDLPQFMSNRSSIIYRLYKSIDNAIINSTYHAVDFFILLSKYMYNQLPIATKPWVVVEGIFNPSDISVKSALHSNLTKKILYTGTLDKRYGVINLIGAFTKIIRSDVELIICGEGNAKKQVIEMANHDRRIKYLGQQPRNKVLQLQQEVDLLINPRTSEGEFTKYSFPSKTMEYMASGTPTLLYRLPGIPDEYYNYCFSLDNNSIESLSEKINEILLMNATSLIKIGQDARNFILQEKNPIKQCMKIIDMINNRNK